MFHWKDNLFFGRQEDGSVRVIKFKSSPQQMPEAGRIYSDDQTLVDVVIPAYEWASVVSAVSKPGENIDTFNQALTYHEGVGYAVV